MRLFLLAAASACVVHASRSPLSFWGIRFRGGSTEGADYASQLESVQTQVLQKASSAVNSLRQSIVEQARVVDDFGHQADLVLNQALQDFTTAAPAVSENEARQAALYDASLSQLEAALDSPLQVLYLKQLALLRTRALEQYRTASASSGLGDYEAMLQADAQFVAQAEASTRPGSDWDYASERSFLQAVMNNMANINNQAVQVKLNSAQTQQTAMQFLQSQQQMIQQLQMQLYGQTSPWNVGVAYRIPDTNFNLQGTYQQGRANVQLSCVPDEYAPFLGPNGFTNGVGPGNLGLSLNLSL